MPQTRKSYVRFNVGAMMKARRELRKEAAIGHKSVQQLKKTADSVAAKRKRLENRVSHSTHNRLGDSENSIFFFF